MKKILGLDLGTNSIGWAVILVDEEDNPVKIIAMGSRIIPLGSDERDQFQRGQAISKNQDRTIARTQRKGYDRRQLRKSNLKKALKKFGLYPSEELMSLSSLELWKLRSDAAKKDCIINAEQLGRILYHLNQKRGYRSSRSEANMDKKDTDYVKEVKGRYALLKEKGQTVGQYIFDGLVDAKNNNTYFRKKEKVFPRDAYIEEFDTIIANQKDQHPFLKDEIIEKIKDEIIFFQRKLKSQKSLVNVCDFEGFETTYFDKDKGINRTIFTGPKVAPKTSPLYQLCKIWENVNNITLKIKNPQGSKYKWVDKWPTLEEKQTIANHLFTNEKLSFVELLKILGLKKDEVYSNKQLLRGLQGNITYAEIHKVLGNNELLKLETNNKPSKHSTILVDKKTGEILSEEAALEIDPNVEKEPFYQLWHTIYSIKDMEECKNTLIKRFAIPAEKSEALSKLDFNKQAYGNKSNKAMRKILPYLMIGYDYSQACSLVGYNHSNSLTKQEQEERKVDDKLKLLPKNSLRQPVVEKVINQMINVVNAIIEIHGKPDEIRVELARELKKSKDERSEADNRNNINKKLNEEITKRLSAMGLPTTRKYIQKYKYIFPSKDKKWKEAQIVNQCIYCGDTFSVTEALSGDSFDVDHIVPKTLLFDDSQTNKVLVHRSCNAAKTNQTAYDFIAKKGERVLNDYLERVDTWFEKGVVSYNKMMRLKVSHEAYLDRKRIKKETEVDKRLWENFIDRQLRESQYIARKSMQILSKICNKVTATEGSVTATLRNLWGWDDVLMNLQLPKYMELEGSTCQLFTEWKHWKSQNGRRDHKRLQIINWDKRDDHRHHAIDALVVACTKQGFIQRINTLNSSDTKDEMQREINNARAKYGKDYDENLQKEANEIVKNHSGKLSKLEEYLISQKPFKTKHVETESDKILVSFKPGKRVATKGVRKAKINGKTKVVQKDIIVPRGALHEQSVYGKIKVLENDKPLKYLLENPENIVDSTLRDVILKRLQIVNGDVKKALSFLKKESLDSDNNNPEPIEKADCYVVKTVMKYKIDSLKANQVDSIVDEGIKRIVKERLDAFNGNEREAFKETLWLNEEKQIPIRTVRLFARPDVNTLETIKKDENGEDIGFVLAGNNHHIAIYQNQEGKPVQHSCTFWHAVERKKHNIPVIIQNTNEVWRDLLEKDTPQSFLDKLPADSLALNFSMQQNEMFVLGLTDEEFEEAYKVKDYSLISKYLYLVWSISNNDYWFRHHLETKNTELKKLEGAKESFRYYRFKSIGSLMSKNPIKIKLNNLGMIEKIGEK